MLGYFCACVLYHYDFLLESPFWCYIKVTMYEAKLMKKKIVYKIVRSLNTGNEIFKNLSTLLWILLARLFKEE